MEIKRALISVYDKDGVEQFAEFLVNRGVLLLATGNTYRFLQSKGIAVQEVSDYTGAPEILNGRVKTLHPAIHGGILSTRKEADQTIEPIDLVAVDLYPFLATEADANSTEEDLIEKIDIGGITLLRAAAKNYRFVLAVSSIQDYSEVMDKLASGEVDLSYRREMAAKAFSVTAGFDADVSRWMNKYVFDDNIPNFISYAGSKVTDLRCGENPQQRGALFSFSKDCRPFTQIAGKELSYNNIADVFAAYGVVKDFSQPAASVIKHCNPCGTAVADNLLDAYIKALSCDPTSSFGGCVAFNHRVTESIANEMIQMFFESVVAPEFDDEALEVFSAKKNVRLIIPGDKIFPADSFSIRGIPGGFILQSVDKNDLDFSSVSCVTSVKPDDSMLKNLEFGWKVCKHVKSNAIVIVKDCKTIGVGAGQMSRVDSVEISIKKAKDCVGAVLVSDGFFPFADSIKLIAEAGIKVVVQPGGSIRDDEIINAANEFGISMLFTGRRTFFH